MRLVARRALLAGVVPVLMLPAAASAACTQLVCVPLDASSARLGSLTDVIGGSGGGGGDGSGVLCAYMKSEAPPPPGYGGDPNKAPYFWWQTQKWGSDNEGTYDFQGCPTLLLCPSPPPLPVDVHVCVVPGS